MESLIADCKNRLAGAEACDYEKVKEELDAVKESERAAREKIKLVQTRFSRNTSSLSEIKKHSAEITALESKPAKKWETMVDKIAWLVVGGCVTYLLSQIGF